MRHQYLFASDSIFIFFFFSLTHHLFYLYIHQCLLLLPNLHHYLRIFLLWFCTLPLCLCLAPFTTLVGFSMRTLSSTLYLTLKWSQTLSSWTILGCKKLIIAQSLATRGEWEIGTSNIVKLLTSAGILKEASILFSVLFRLVRRVDLQLWFSLNFLWRSKILLSL